MTSVDIQNNQLNGANRYVIHFPKDLTPPVNAFWSLTLYDMDQFFVKNPINRYAIGDRNELAYNEDGSLDIYIQHEPPEGQESNWLPAPEGDFNLIMRLYWPTPDIINGEWQLPTVQRFGSLT